MQEQNSSLSSSHATTSSSAPRCKGRVGPFFGGLVAGIVLAGVAGWLMMPGLMLVVHESRYDTIAETCDQLQGAIEQQGWASPGVRDMNASMARQGVQLGDPIRIVELCNAGHAQSVLATNPEVSTLMPCAWGVYHNDEGAVCIAGMNMGLMGRMFGGNIARVMARVAAEEAQMLERVVRH